MQIMYVSRHAHQTPDTTRKRYQYRLIKAKFSILPSGEQQHLFVYPNAEKCGNDLRTYRASLQSSFPRRLHRSPARTQVPGPVYLSRALGLAMRGRAPAAFHRGRVNSVVGTHHQSHAAHI